MPKVKRELSLSPEESEYESDNSFQPTNSRGTRTKGGKSRLDKKKKKLAPRSSLQFKVGPSFSGTTHFQTLYASSSNCTIVPNISARVDRGFDKLDGEWVGYKRNYFTLVAAFQFKNSPEDLIERETFYIIEDGIREEIECFALKLVAKCHEDETPVPLVQHTAKRDRGPQTVPPIYPAIPSHLPRHEVIREVANIRNNNKIDKYNQLFFAPDVKMGNQAPIGSILRTYPDGLEVAKVAKYERIQFSSSESHKRTAMTNKHSILEVQLIAVLDNDDEVLLASTKTPPLVVRGRSPSNYHIARKEMLAKQKDLIQSYDSLPNADLNPRNYEKEYPSNKINEVIIDPQFISSNIKETKKTSKRKQKTGKKPMRQLELNDINNYFELLTTDFKDNVTNDDNLVDFIYTSDQENENDYLFHYNNLINEFPEKSDYNSEEFIDMNYIIDTALPPNDARNVGFEKKLTKSNLSKTVPRQEVDDVFDEFQENLLRVQMELQCSSRGSSIAI